MTTIFNLMHKDAVLPTRATEFSAGYDLTVIAVHRDREHNVLIYDTGVNVSLAPNQWGDVRPRSSIYRKGPFVLANSCGVVDADYPGTIKLIFRPLSDDISIDDEAPYRLGEKAAQLIIQEYITDKEQTTPKIKRTGGHGSTDARKTSKKTEQLL